MPVRLLEPAAEELDEAVAWYNAQVRGLGDTFLVEVLRVLSLVERYPRAWHPLGESTRRCRLSRFPYGVVYAVEPEEILVIALAHLHRRPGYWRERLRRVP
ncbi:MAG: type II toxin-antitoxin system RelE/ParE family toxin [Burkholderiales bacterium]